jgi:transcriptional regulator with XRE-family HTH domain
LRNNNKNSSWLATISDKPSAFRGSLPSDGTASGYPLACAPKRSAEDFVSEDRVAVGEAILQRRRELKMTQRELGKRSKVSTATIRQIENRTGSHRHSPRTLEAISEALGWPPEYLSNVLNGRPQREVAEQASDEATLQSLLDGVRQLLHKVNLVEQRLGNVLDVIYNSDSELDVSIQIKHARHDR